MQFRNETKPSRNVIFFPPRNILKGTEVDRRDKEGGGEGNTGTKGSVRDKKLLHGRRLYTCIPRDTPGTSR